MSDDGLLYRKM